MTMSHEIDISSILDQFTQSDSVTQTLVPQPGTFVTTNAPFVPAAGTYVTVSHGAAPVYQVQGRYVSNTGPVATANGSYVTSQLR